MKLPLIFLALLPVLAFGQTNQDSSKYFGKYEYQNKANSSEDSLYFINLDGVLIRANRNFTTREDQSKYNKYMRYAALVYPYAREGIRLYYDVKTTEKTMKSREHKKYVKNLNKQVKEQFEDPLKKLTKLQGLVMLKMIEKELDTPIYSMISDLRGSFNAFYWNSLGALNGYHLKEGYIKGSDPILDIVLEDYAQAFADLRPKP
ncbi:MAG: DUF4294 domain-containing protein [Saprospiraceae bacterium]